MGLQGHREALRERKDLPHCRRQKVASTAVVGRLSLGATYTSGVDERALTTRGDKTEVGNLPYGSCQVMGCRDISTMYAVCIAVLRACFCTLPWPPSVAGMELPTTIPRSPTPTYFVDAVDTADTIDPRFRNYFSLVVPTCEPANVLCSTYRSSTPERALCLRHSIQLCFRV